MKSRELFVKEAREGGDEGGSERWHAEAPLNFFRLRPQFERRLSFGSCFFRLRGRFFIDWTRLQANANSGRSPWRKSAKLRVCKTLRFGRNSTVAGKRKANFFIRTHWSLATLLGINYREWRFRGRDPRAPSLEPAVAGVTLEARPARRELSGGGPSPSSAS